MLRNLSNPVPKHDVPARPPPKPPGKNEPQVHIYLSPILRLLRPFLVPRLNLSSLQKLLRHLVCFLSLTSKDSSLSETRTTTVACYARIVFY